MNLNVVGDRAFQFHAACAALPAGRQVGFYSTRIASGFSVGKLNQFCV
jgi:hypothetical protein